MPLTASKLTVGWNRRAVARLNELQLQAGSILVLAGPNGVGKSTVVKTLARQIEPLSGTVKIDEQDAFAMDAKCFAKSIGYVPQIVEPARHITVEDLVALGRNPHQMWWRWELNAEDKQAIDQALEKTGTTQLRTKNVHALSGGERQRAVIAMALAQQTRFILLDEPTAHLDFRHQLELLALLKELREQGLGLLLVLHDLNLIARVADQVVLLKKDDQNIGTVAACGAPPDVLNGPVLKDVYAVEIAISTDPTTGLTSYVPTSLD